MKHDLLFIISSIVPVVGTIHLFHIDNWDIVICVQRISVLKEYQECWLALEPEITKKMSSKLIIVSNLHAFNVAFPSHTKQQKCFLQYIKQPEKIWAGTPCSLGCWTSLAFDFFWIIRFRELLFIFCQCPSFLHCSVFPAQDRHISPIHLIQSMNQEKNVQYG